MTYKCYLFSSICRGENRKEKCQPFGEIREDCGLATTVRHTEAVGSSGAQTMKFKMIH